MIVLFLTYLSCLIIAFFIMLLIISYTLEFNSVEILEVIHDLEGILLLSLASILISFALFLPLYLIIT
jgi:hypothetical protein